MRIDFEGRSWELNPSRPTLKQAMVIQDKTGLSLSDWEESLLMQRPEDEGRRTPPAEWLLSMAALYWLMRAQSGDPVDFDDADFDVWSFTSAYFRALHREIEAARAKAAEVKTELAPFPPSAPPSTEPATPTATTLTPPAPVPAPTAYSPPVTSPGSAPPTYSSWPGSAASPVTPSTS